jgi:hypothetical protein
MEQRSSFADLGHWVTMGLLLGGIVLVATSLSNESNYFHHNTSRHYLISQGSANSDPAQVEPGAYYD